MERTVIDHAANSPADYEKHGSLLRGEVGAALLAMRLTPLSSLADLIHWHAEKNDELPIRAADDFVPLHLLASRRLTAGLPAEIATRFDIALALGKAQSDDTGWPTFRWPHDFTKTFFSGPFNLIRKGRIVVRLAIFVVVALLGSSGAAFSEASDCNIEAFKAMRIEDSSLAVMLAQLKLINEANYEEAKKSASAIIPEYFAGDFKSFAAKRASMYQETRFNYSVDEAKHLVTSGVDENGLAAYTACLQSRSPLTAVVTKSPSQQIVSLRIRFEPKSAIPNPNPLIIQVIGGESFGVVGDQKDKIVEASVGPGERIYVFKRVPNSEFVAVVQMPSLSLAANDVSLPPPPVLKEIVQTKSISVNGGPMHLDHPTGAPVGKSAGPVQTCAAADAGWELIPDTAALSFSETRPGCFTGKSAVADESKVCFNVTLSINAGDSCDVNWTVSTKQRRTVKVFQ
ncbi:MULTISPECIES: hypothetical protein [unclassified Bradyrhizobium]|uniref:hypothetical protein n=1 Tax=unclassified Bradyrhizobium TaxID=2631580 RepID=UPI0028E84812|nr:MULTISPECIES: hypothetical protein [unclassified Bradyrhizobium]